MSDLAIRIDNLSKSYRIPHARHVQQVGRYKTLQEDLLALPWRLLSAVRGRNGAGRETIWALRDISLEIRQGEVLGIIGRNGAGKSTLLKILSRITEPTQGRAEIYGRVGSLLEVGTGFHPELTGRENIFLNGAILGMRRTEIARKLDEIVAFAEVDTFIDTPVKFYSSGMYVRLAFAVAAQLEPEILVVDEVLAVGDYEFQKKCLGKMGEIAKGGRTVVFVSHNMSSILNLCSRVVLLDSGRSVFDGDPSSAVDHYIAAGSNTDAEAIWNEPTDAPGDDTVRLRAVRVRSEDGKARSEFGTGEEIVVEIEFWNLRPGARLCPVIALTERTGQYVLASPDLPSARLTDDPVSDRPLPAGLFRSVCRIPANLLNAMTYGVIAGIDSNIAGAGRAVAYDGRDVIQFRVFDSGEMRKEWANGDWSGFVRPRLAWHTEYIGAVGNGFEQTS